MYNMYVLIVTFPIRIFVSSISMRHLCPRGNIRIPENANTLKYISKSVNVSTNLFKLYCLLNKRTTCGKPFVICPIVRRPII